MSYGVGDVMMLWKIFHTKYPTLDRELTPMERRELIADVDKMRDTYEAMKAKEEFAAAKAMGK